MIGLDLGTKYIKICQVIKRNEGYHIVSAAMSATPAFDGDPKQKSEIIRKIKAIAREACIAPNIAAASIGNSEIIARNFTMPLLPKDELDGAVRLEAEQSVFSDMNSMYTDSQILGSVDKEKVDVLFVGVPKSIVDERVPIIKGTGFELGTMDIDNLALVNCFLAFEPEPEKESVVLLDVGHTYTNISVLDSGQLRFIRNVAFGGKDISQEISNSYGMYFEMAEEIKKRPQLWGEIGLNMKNILKKSASELLEAIYRSIEYCMGRKKLLNVDKILLTGGTSSLQGFDSFVSDVLGIPTVKWNPIAHISTTGECRKEQGQFLGVSLGLAIRENKNA